MNSAVQDELEKLVQERTRDFQMQASMFSAIFDSSSDFMFCKNLDLNYTHCNKSTEIFFNIKAEDIIGKTDAEVFGLLPRAAKKSMLIDRKVINEKQSIVFEERINIPQSLGQELIVETMKTPIMQNGEVIGILGISRDITKRKEIEKELELQTATLTALFDSIPDPIFTKDLRLRFLQCNRSFLEHFDLRKEDIIGKSDAEVLGLSAGKSEILREWDRQVILEDRTITKEVYTQQNEDGTAQIIETVKTPLMLNGIMIGVLCMARDITKFKQMEDAALAASHAKSTFLANMSHEIRTPMNSIIGFSELALDCRISPKVKNYLTNILKNSEWLLQIINDILDISKVESGRMELESSPFDLHELFTSCRTIIMPKVAEKDLKLHFYVEASIGKRLLGDSTRLRQVFVNLLSNAVKFTNTGDSIKVLAIVKEESEKSVTMYFEVKDSGIGMTDEQMEKVFLPFMQAEAGTTRKYGGTGLGLPITRNIIELMGGRLFVESAPNAGSKFGFELTFDSIEAPDDEMLKKKITMREFEKPVFKGEILVCEDNPMNQQVISEHLTRVGFEVVIAENGKIGVEMIKDRMKKANGKKQFDLIFMDIHMPVMDGLEATAEIARLNTGIPIVAMTANIMSEDVATYRKNGMSECVGKPFTSQELWRCLLNYFTPLSWQIVEEDRHAQAKDNLRQKLIGNFVKDNQTKFTEITDALNNDDIKLAHRLAHTLKSNAAHLGSTRLKLAAADIENNLSNGKNLVTQEQMLLFETELNAALSQFTAELEAGSTEQHEQSPLHLEPLDADHVQELLIELEPMLEMGNPECINFIGDLRRIPPIRPGSSEIEDLIQHIESFDFERAFVMLAALKAAWD